MPEYSLKDKASSPILLYHGSNGGYITAAKKLHYPKLVQHKKEL
jgi:hypothetical protein